MHDRQDVRDAARRDPFRRAFVSVPRGLAVALNIGALIVLVVAPIAARTPAAILGYFALGAGIGLVTCIPIGVANVIVIDSAIRYGVARAIGAAIGGALADGIYSSIGMFGVDPLLARHPMLPRILRAVSGAVLVIYGLLLVRARGDVAPQADVHALAPRAQVGRGVLVGLAATLLNPSALVTWVVIVGAHAVGLGVAERGAWVFGIVVGTFAWFLVVTFLAVRGKRALRGNAIWMTRLAGLLVLAWGVVCLVRILLQGDR
jgi:L-lysine exporter family protein LysE/ArgO